MTFKVGDRVEDVSSGYVKSDGSKVDTGTVVSVLNDGDVRVSFDNTIGSWFCRKGEVKLAHIGKTLTELDVKPGDVVRGVDCTYSAYKDFTCIEIVNNGIFDGEHRLVSDNYGRGIFGNEDGKWIIISRAPQPSAEPEKPKPMHPDDAATACEQYLRDCGFTMARLDLVTALGAEYTIEPPRRF